MLIGILVSFAFVMVDIKSKFHIIHNVQIQCLHHKSLNQSFTSFTMSKFNAYITSHSFDSSQEIYVLILKDVLFMQVQACGSMVTEEQPHAMLIPMEFFLMGYGLYRPCHFSDSPRSPLSPSCISPELLSPESMGLKLKPIKTRVSLEV
jgi:hypothetical protein